MTFVPLRPITHTKSFKLLNVNLSNNAIFDITDKAKIIKDPAIIGLPDSQTQSHIRSSLFGDFIHSRFIESLVNSEIKISVKYTAEEMNDNPFDVDNVAFIALSLAIAYDSSFVAGFEDQNNNQENKTVIISPYSSPIINYFCGENTPLIIDESNIITLKNIYDFVSSSFKVSSENKENMKLLMLLAKALVFPKNNQYTVLDVGFPTILSPEQTMIANAALLFEYIFTKESRNVRAGVNLWNSSNINQYLTLNGDEVMLIMNYRHILFHDNPTTAKTIITDWQSLHSIDDSQKVFEILKISTRLVKQIIRTRILQLSEYNDYRNSLQ